MQNIRRESPVPDIAVPSNNTFRACVGENKGREGCATGTISAWGGTPPLVGSRSVKNLPTLIGKFWASTAPNPFNVLFSLDAVLDTR